MRSQLGTLTSADIQRFERDGYVVVRQAFSRADGLAMKMCTPGKRSRIWNCSSRAYDAASSCL